MQLFLVVLALLVLLALYAAFRQVTTLLEKRDEVNRGFYARCAAITEEFGVTLLEGAIKTSCSRAS